MDIQNGFYLVISKTQTSKYKVFGGEQMDSVEQEFQAQLAGSESGFIMGIVKASVYHEYSLDIKRLMILKEMGLE